MARGFRVRQRIGRSPRDVWAFLSDFENAPTWMAGVEQMTKVTPGPLAEGTRYTFRARGRARETRVSAFEPGRMVALTSSQGGITATYTYKVRPDGDGSEVSLDAECSAAGLWVLLHPLIAVAMRRADSGQLARLAAVIERKPAGERP